MWKKLLSAMMDTRVGDGRVLRAKYAIPRRAPRSHILCQHHILRLGVSILNNRTMSEDETF